MVQYSEKERDGSSEVSSSKLSQNNTDQAKKDGELKQALKSKAEKKADTSSAGGLSQTVDRAQSPQNT